MFCAFWALDIPPTLDVLVLFFQPRFRNVLGTLFSKTPSQFYFPVIFNIILTAITLIIGVKFGDSISTLKSFEIDTRRIAKPNFYDKLCFSMAN